MTPRLLTLTLSIIFIIGIWVRWYNLENHFTHVDDIIIADNILKKKEEVTADSSIRFKTLAGVFKSSHFISRNLTYAPLQFWITSSLIHSGQNYRQTLFRGRLPSFLFSIAGLFVFLVFYQKFKPENPFPYQLLGLTLLAFSWENIIYAQQMESYSIGIAAILLLLIILLQYMKKESLSWLNIILLGFFSALLVHSQYQVLFFLPALYLTLFIFYLNNRKEKSFLLISKFFFSIVTFILLCWPMYHNYLRHHTQGGINWNAGPNREFLFSLSNIEGLWDKIIYSFKFFLINFFAVFKMEIAFLPVDNILFKFLSSLLFLLFSIGVISFIYTKERPKKYLGIFLGVSAAIWLVLIILQKLALSPTRHSLILLPLFIFLICEGLSFSIELVRSSGKTQLAYLCSLGLSLSIVIFFFTSFKEVNALRKDLFEEKEITSLLHQYKPDLVIEYFFTYNIALMKEARETYPLFEGDRWQIDEHTPDCSNMNTLALVSARMPYPSEYFSCQKGFMDVDRELILADSTNGDFKLVFKKELTSDIEIDFNTPTMNGTNSLYLYIFKRIKK